ncbi:MAG TPA: glycine zipper family protein [Desulfuromonadales bacterium]|nr:glycine zipper family protein [Desulfuromonadales bacterium]
MKRFICMLIIASHLSACATYENRAISFRPPQDYTNFQNADGLMIGAESFSDKQTAEDAFGFDIRGAGLLPIQIVLDNASGQGIEVVSGQTFLIDGSNRYWKILANEEAIERVQKATESGAIGSGAGKGAAFGAAAGALLGLALGIVSGRNAAESMVKGGVIGGAGGAVIGGAGKAGDNRQQENKIANDVREKGVEGKIMQANALANGFIFFPAEAQSVKELRLQLRFRNSGVVKNINLRLR